MNYETLNKIDVEPDHAYREEVLILPEAITLLIHAT